MTIVVQRNKPVRYSLLLLAFLLGGWVLAEPFRGPARVPGNSEDYARIEQQVAAEVNRLRSNPPGHIQVIEQVRPRYHGIDYFLFMRGDTEVVRPIQEGVAGLDDAVRALRSAAPVSSLSSALARAARDHLEDETRAPQLSHIGTDGSNPLDRIRRYDSKVVLAGEVMAAGYEDPPDVMRGFLIDDGQPNRPHRHGILNPAFRVMGVACSGYKKFGLMCVIDFTTESGE